MFTIKSFHVSLEVWGSFFCLFTTLCVYLNTGFERYKKNILLAMQFCTAILLVMDALAWGFRGSPGMLGYYMVRISNFSVFILEEVLVLLFHVYVCYMLFGEEAGKQGQKLPYRVQLVWIIAIIAILLIVVSQFTDLYYYFDEYNVYHRNSMHPMSLLIGLLAGFLDASLLVQYRTRIGRHSFWAMLSYLLLPFLAAVVTIFFYGISFVNIATTISMLFMFAAAMAEQGQILLRKEKENYEMRITVLTSQIGPHFIYNTLSVIKYLCRKDPSLAVETIDEFALYLRGNLNFMAMQRKISFEQELMHVKSYLSIVQKRFGDLVRVEYHIECAEFLIPALTLQPLAENAVKYGIMEREEGGTLSVSSQREEHHYVVCMEDDGVGFVYEEVRNDEKVHIGLKNVKERIETMCGGTMEVYSKPGEGTRITIRLPDCQG